MKLDAVTLLACKAVGAAGVGAAVAVGVAVAVAVGVAVGVAVAVGEAVAVGVGVGFGQPIDSTAVEPAKVAPPPHHEATPVKQLCARSYSLGTLFEWPWPPRVAIGIIDPHPAACYPHFVVQNEPFAGALASTIRGR